MASLTLSIDKWLNQTLKADAQLAAEVSFNIYSEVAPPDTPSKFVIFNSQSGGGNDTLGSSAQLIKTKSTYLIKAVGEGRTYTSLDNAHKRIDSVLHRSRGSVNGAKIISCVRVGEVKYPERNGDKEYRHLGSLFEIQAQEQAGGVYSYEKLS